MINDLTSAGDQPLHNQKQTVHVIVNGEIYDYDRLREEMIEKEKYQFQGRSDSELVLALYQHYGAAFVSELRGEFALCLYDSERRTFLAVRDRYGIKPLFWTVVNGELLVAAEMKALIPLGLRPEWNVPAIIDGSHQIGPTTILKNVQKVDGQILQVEQRLTPEGATRSHAYLSAFWSSSRATVLGSRFPEQGWILHLVHDFEADELKQEPGRNPHGGRNDRGRPLTRDRSYQASPAS